jgi:hypothetical protein
MTDDTIREAGPDVQALCAHSRCSWAVKEIENDHARGPILWTCLDCGTRTGNAQPYIDHPAMSGTPA